MFNYKLHGQVLVGTIAGERINLTRNQFPMGDKQHFASQTGEFLGRIYLSEFIYSILCEMCFHVEMPI